MIMKNSLFRVLCLVFMVASCSPMQHVVHVEMRYPSKSGLELAGKNVAVVQLENDNTIANPFAEGMADGLAFALEQDYGTGEGSVGIYRMRVSPEGRYFSRDTLLNLVMDTGADVVFLIDTVAVKELKMGGATSVAVKTSVDSSYISTGTLPFTMNLYCYDAMGKNDKVYTFKGSSTAVPFAYSDGKQADDEIMSKAVASLPEVGFEAGKTVSSSFKSQWKHEQYSVIYFDGSQWYKAVSCAEQYMWRDAMEIWLGLLDTNDLLRRACAEYNLAVASYMLGDYSLAEKWLDLSDADNKLPLSDGMRKRINARK